MYNIVMRPLHLLAYIYKTERVWSAAKLVYDLRYIIEFYCCACTIHSDT